MQDVRERYMMRYCLRQTATGGADIPPSRSDGFSRRSPARGTVTADAPEASGGVVSSPLVSVCVAHYNHARYLPRALDSLAVQDYSNFEVLVADDSSSDPEARRVFAEQKHLRDSRFRFFEKANSGPGGTRNVCAEKARGVYLVFMDSDNVAAPDMLRRFAAGMQRSGLDALTCHFEAFAHDWEGSGAPPKRLYRAMPLGPDVLSGVFENPYGDTNMIVKADVFRKLGGMCDTREGVEDWEFLARLALGGGSQDVIPETLFYYRLTPQGISRNNAKEHASAVITQTYKRYGSSLLPDIVDHLLVPFYRNERPERVYSVFMRQAERIGEGLEKTYQKLCPPGSRRQRFSSWLRRVYGTLR